MPVRPSRSVDIARLVGDLASSNELQRESAVARLAVMGPRAVAALTALAGSPSASVDARDAALRALESTPDSRATALALQLLADGPETLATSALALLGHAARGHGPAATRAFDCVAALALDADAPIERRLAAVLALDGQSPRVMQPIVDALARDPASRLLTRVARPGGDVRIPLDQALERGWPDDPAAASVIVRDADRASVTTLHRALKTIRDEERRHRGERRAGWTAVRGQVHQAIATRGSRVAIYDLREALGSELPLPVGFLSAAAAVGDATCLEPLAARWIAAGTGDRWWREHLAETFATIVRRDALTRRHPTLVRILTRWPSAGVLVATAPKR